MLIRLRGCAGGSAPLLFTYGIRHIFAWPGPFTITSISLHKQLWLVSNMQSLNFYHDICDCSLSWNCMQSWSASRIFKLLKWELCLCWGLTSQSTIFQSCRDGATASWVINQYFQGVKCLAQGHNTAAVGIEPPTSRSRVRREQHIEIFIPDFKSSNYIMPPIKVFFKVTDFNRSCTNQLIPPSLFRLMSLTKYWVPALDYWRHYQIRWETKITMNKCFFMVRLTF